MSTTHKTIVHYTIKNGNEQYALQKLAADILKYGKKKGVSRSYNHQHSPDGSSKIIETGSSGIEVENELTGSRYWVHLSGCKVTEIIEEYNEEE